MRKLITLAFTLFFLSAFGQTPPPLKARSNDQFTQVDGFLAASKGFSFPAGSTNTLLGVGTRASLFWNTTEHSLYVFDGVTWRPIGAGSTLKVKSANIDIGLTLVGDTTVFTLNSGLGANKIVKRDAEGFMPVTSGSRIGSVSSNDIAYQAVLHNFYRYSSGSISGHYLRLSNNGGTDIFEVFPQDAIGFPGLLYLYNLRSGKTTPTPSGTEHVLTIDANGLVGHRTIPSGGGTIGYNSGDYVGRITNGISWDSGANNYITANSTTRVFNYNAGTSSYGGHEFYTSSNNLRFKISTYGEITAPDLASGSTTPTPTGTEHMLTIDANGLFGHRAIPSGGGGTWGSITGTLSSQSDLQTALNGKQATISGTGFVKASGSTISYDNTSYLSLAGGTLSGAVTGTTFTASGGFFDTSDITLKKIVKKRYNASMIPAITYKWKEGKDKNVHVGYSAQQVKKYMPQAVKKGANGKLSVNYIEVLVQKISELEREIAMLKKKSK